MANYRIHDDAEWRDRCPECGSDVVHTGDVFVEQHCINLHCDWAEAE